MATLQDFSALLAVSRIMSSVDETIWSRRTSCWRNIQEPKNGTQESQNFAATAALIETWINKESLSEKNEARQKMPKNLQRPRNTNRCLGFVGRITKPQFVYFDSSRTVLIKLQCCTFVRLPYSITILLFNMHSAMWTSRFLHEEKIISTLVQIPFKPF